MASPDISHVSRAGAVGAGVSVGRARKGPTAAVAALGMAEARPGGGGLQRPFQGTLD